MKEFFNIFIVLITLNSCGIYKLSKESKQHEIEEKKYFETHYFEGNFGESKYIIDVFNLEPTRIKAKVIIDDSVFNVAGINKAGYFLSVSNQFKTKLTLSFYLISEADKILIVTHTTKKDSVYIENNIIQCKPKEKNLILSKLNDSSYVYTTYQEYEGQKFPANGFLKITSEGVVMIDTPWDSTQFQPLLDEIDFRFHLPVKLVIATHSHADRTNGLEYYAKLGIPTYTSRATQRICEERGEKKSEFHFLKDTLFQVGNTQIQTFYPGAGHAPDNIVIWFPADKILFGGCFIKSTEAENIGNLSDANVGMWPVALRLVKNQFKHPTFVIPGHQGWSDKKSIKYTLKLLRDLGKEKDEEE